MTAIDDDRNRALTAEIVGEHISRVRAAQTRFCIRDSRRIFNLDQTGISFAKMTKRSIRKGIGTRKRNLVTTNVKTKGNLDHVTVMSIVSAAGDTLTPTVVYPGKMCPFRKVQGSYESLHRYLPKCLLFHREIAGVDSMIFMEAMKQFVQETVELRRGGHKLLLILDGYAAHVQYTVLNYLKQNGVIVLGLPAHTSHVLQPLDVTVFAAFKSYLQRHLHRAARDKRTLDAFDVGHIVKLAYSESLTGRNIMSGFHKKGIWDNNQRLASIDALKDLAFFTGDKENGSLPTVSEGVASWKDKTRTLLMTEDVEDTGHVRVDTSHGAHLTDDNVLSILKKRDEKRREAEEKKDDKRRMIALAPIRAIRRARLRRNRAERRRRQKVLINSTRHST